MKFGDLLHKSISANRTMNVLSRALDIRSAKHNVISGNLANIDTPGFQPQKIDFKEELKGALGRTSVQLKKTNQKHFSHYQGNSLQGENKYNLQTDTKKLSIDKEMSRMAQNNLLYEVSAKLLTKKFEALKLVIDSGRR